MKFRPTFSAEINGLRLSFDERRVLLLQVDDSLITMKPAHVKALQALLAEFMTSVVEQRED